MKSEKTAVKNAILYLKDYICAYNERRASDTGRKLLESVNVVIDFFNEIENKEQEECDNKKMREAFFNLAFGFLGEFVDMQEAVNIPMEYYVKRIGEKYMQVSSVEFRFFFAYRDYMERKRSITYLHQAQKALQEYKADDTMTATVRAGLIRSCEADVEFCMDMVKQLS